MKTRILKPRSVRFAAALAVLAAGCLLAAQGDGKGQATKGKQAAMDHGKLPFGIESSHLGEAEVMLGFYSAKAGAGKQEITITGDGRVKLLLTKTYNEAPTIREGKLDPAVSIRLLDLLEGQGILNLEDEYPSDHDPHARRTVQLTLPGGRIKSVALDEPGVPAVEQMFGAIKLAAGVALPEALNHRFFPNL